MIKSSALHIDKAQFYGIIDAIQVSIYWKGLKRSIYSLQQVYDGIS